MSTDIAFLSNEDIVRLCHSPQCQIISGSSKLGRRVMKLFNNIVIKAGPLITADEAANQDHAYKLYQGTNLIVPEVYRYFRLGGEGYIVMEFIDGVSLKEMTLVDQVDPVKRLAVALSTTAGDRGMNPEKPGPRNGGVPHGYILSEFGAGTAFDSIDGLNSWLNTRARLRNGEKGFNYELSDCTFCHLDLAPRNILVLPDEKICVLDWESAGFYPAVFEDYCIRFIGQWDYEYSEMLLDALRAITPDDDRYSAEKERQIMLLDRVYRNNLAYHFGPEPDHAVIQRQIQNIINLEANKDSL